MNTEDFVTYEQALALKKLGFREECLYHYKDREIYPNSGGLSSMVVDDYYNIENYMSDSTLCDAPTLAQAQKWLRKVKGLYLIWDMGQDRKHNSKFAWYVNDCHGYIIDILASEVKYDSTEEALSEGITECLKFLGENE